MLVCVYRVNNIVPLSSNAESNGGSKPPPYEAVRG